MSKARTLANFVSAGNPLSDGAIAASEVTGLSTVATTGAYNDLSGKPSLATVATSGSYNDLSNKPANIGSLSGGVAGNVPYQSGVATTAFVTNGTAGQLLQSNGSSAPSYVNQSSLSVGASTNLAGGSNGTIPYQSASGTTQMLAVGTAGQLLQTNGAGAPSWVTPAPGAGTVTAVASGSITSQAPVVINSDGTVSEATGSISGQTLFPIGTSIYNMLQDNYTYYACYCTGQNAILISYRNTGTNYWMAMAGSISSSGSITWGTPITIVSNYYDNHNAVWNSAAGVGVLFARQAGNNIQYVEVTVSGNTVTASGAAQAMASNPGNNPIWCAYSASADRIFLATNNGSGGGLYALQRTGSNAYSTPAGAGLALAFSGIAVGNSSKGVLIGLNGSNLQAQAFTFVSPSTLNTGTELTLQASYSTNGMSIAYNSADNNYVVTYQFYNGTGYLRANALTVSGTTITAGTQTAINTFSGGYPTYNSISYSPSTNSFLAFYNASNTAESGYGSVITVVGTTITVVNTSSVSGNYTYYTRSLFDSSNNYSLLVYRNASLDVISGRELTLSYSGNASQALLGFSSAAYTNGQTATINTVGSTATKSGLTPATKYYLSLNGSLSTSTTSNYAGLALTSTNLVIKG